MLTFTKSDNVISPFDEKDDPKTTELGMPDMVASPLPVRSGMFHSLWSIIFVC
jgi:hypothetical protein